MSIGTYSAFICLMGKTANRDLTNKNEICISAWSVNAARSSYSGESEVVLVV